MLNERHLVFSCSVGSDYVEPSYNHYNGSHDNTLMGRSLFMYSCLQHLCWQEWPTQLYFHNTTGCFVGAERIPGLYNFKISMVAQCTPFPTVSSFNPETVSKRCTALSDWTCPWYRLLICSGASHKSLISPALSVKFRVAAWYLNELCLKRPKCFSIAVETDNTRRYPFCL